ncbi:hypothetical protein D8674_041864 [Pyrus ussuriensis x Pyrus communis]|uniref:LysM domain-containing protein n=1 Tax=Pyrus ussuriensis x Pyrus communis TaxID=2448454 RepID=A0A5N5FLM6_9ROSA|nr:hypothetical protein D8674_041864 [Pyrus ussuriensis x Pyrus communis]
MAVIVSNKKAAMSRNLVLLFCLLLIISFAEGKQLGIGFGGLKAAPRAPRCQKVYGAKLGDTCDGIIQKFKLNASHFSEINPNLNRDSIFVGQWLCIVGTAK